jgi:hypothetical protein
MVPVEGIELTPWFPETGFFIQYGGIGGAG